MTTVTGFERNVLGYFDALFTTEPIELDHSPQEVEFELPDFAGDLPHFARKSILWGRKSGTMLAKAAAQPAYRIPRPDSAADSRRATGAPRVPGSTY